MKGLPCFGTCLKRRSYWDVQQCWCRTAGTDFDEVGQPISGWWCNWPPLNFSLGSDFLIPWLMNSLCSPTRIGPLVVESLSPLSDVVNCMIMIWLVVVSNTLLWRCRSYWNCGCFIDISMFFCRCFFWSPWFFGKTSQQAKRFLVLGWRKKKKTANSSWLVGFLTKKSTQLQAVSQCDGQGHSFTTAALLANFASREGSM